MKKLAVSLILGASLAIAPSVFALTAMSDANMKSATAQAGVSLALDNVQIEQFIGSTAYTDDGVDVGGGTLSGGGSIVISNRHTIQGFFALPSDGGTTNHYYEAAFKGHLLSMGVAAADVAGITNMGHILQTHALTIDVGACPILSIGEYLNAHPTDMTDPVAAAAATAAALGSNTTAMTGVIIGLPTILCTTTADSYSVGVAAVGPVGSKNNGAKMITISQGPSATAILSGSIEIAAH